MPFVTYGETGQIRHGRSASSCWSAVAVILLPGSLMAWLVTGGAVIHEEVSFEAHGLSWQDADETFIMIGFEPKCFMTPSRHFLVSRFRCGDSAQPFIHVSVPETSPYRSIRVTALSVTYPDDSVEELGPPAMLELQSHSVLGCCFVGPLSEIDRQVTHEFRAMHQFASCQAAQWDRFNSCELKCRVVLLTPDELKKTVEISGTVLRRTSQEVQPFWTLKDWVPEWMDPPSTH